MSLNLPQWTWRLPAYAAFLAAPLPACNSSDPEASGAGGSSAAGNASATGGRGSQGGGAGGGGAAGGVAPVSEPGKPCRSAVKAGGFIVQMTDVATAASGYVQDGVTPTAVWNELSSSGRLRHSRTSAAVLRSTCTGTQTCGLAGSCIEMPLQRSVGAVTVTGLSTSVSMTPDSVYQQLLLRRDHPATGLHRGGRDHAQRGWRRLRAVQPERARCGRARPDERSGHGHGGHPHHAHLDTLRRNRRTDASTSV